MPFGQVRHENPAAGWLQQTEEGNSVLSVIANLQARLAQVEARLEDIGIVASN